MLDSFEILTTSGVVLWSRAYATVNPSVVNSFIADVFIEEKNKAVDQSANPPYKHDKHTLRWTVVKELGIIFVAVYRSLLHLSWIDKLVDNIKTIFVKLYGEQLTRPNTTVVECLGFDEYFNQQLGELEGGDVVQETHSVRKPPPPEDSENSQTDNDQKKDRPAGAGAQVTADTSRPSSSGSNAPTGKLSRKARKAQNKAAQTVQNRPRSAMGSSADESGPSRRGKQPAKGKKGRKWDADGLAGEESNVQLDYSAPDSKPTTNDAAAPQVDASTWGTKTKGKFVLRDLDDEVHSMLAETEKEEKKSGLVGSGLNALGGLLRNVVGGKVLAKEDLDGAMRGLEEHLLKKNVAREAAVRLCDGVERELVGARTGSFESVNSRARAALEASLTKMLTPTSSLDLLREIDGVAGSKSGARPYVVSVVGVNGVGKSTNLSKMCYFLLQNKYRVLVAAADTFRSGAVEQLAVHVRNLQELAAREGGHVELFQRGYGRDAASVAKDAVAFAAQQRFDVVLIDTAGRRHNDQRLMSSLDKFAKLARPDKILMVGEALVGTDSVAQAQNFNAAFGAGRTLDGFIISKCDTVGDMVGTLVSLVHATNVPVLFVGVGQHYSDLRNFSVRWAVDKLLSSA